jgi:predicted aspartyl protease
LLRPLTFAPFTIFVLLLALAGCAQGSGCDVVKVTQVPLETRSRVFGVPVTVNGHAISMLLDTGATRSLLAETTVKRLGVVRDGRTSTILVGLAGGSMITDANIETMSLGGAAISMDRLSVDPFERRQGIDGVLGLDILRDFDLDIDAPRRALTLYRVRHCEHADPPWDERATAIAGVSTRSGWMDVPLAIDGVEEAAVVDTGASHTVITPRFARRLGLTDEALANDRIVPLRVINSSGTQARAHRFQTIRIGPITVHNAYVLVLSKNPLPLGGGRQFREAVIGQDFLADRRVWFSMRTGRLFISRKDNDTITENAMTVRTPFGQVALATGH